MTRKTVKRG